MKTVLCLVLLCLQLAASAGQQTATPGSTEGPWQAENHSVTFTYVATGAPHTIGVAGSFNGWNPSTNPLHPKQDRVTWTVTLPLSPGIYGYKFVIDGKRWMTDPNAKAEDDGSGNMNSVLVVKPDDYEKLPGVVGDGRITSSAVRHEALGRYVQRPDAGHLALTLRTRHNDIRTCELLLPAENGKPQQKFSMVPSESDPLFDYWHGAVPLSGTKTLRYAFLLSDGATSQLYDVRNAPAAPTAPPRWFNLDLTQFPPFTVPDWVHDAVFYQIFPDRFADGDPSNNGTDPIPWGGAPSSSKRMGGDLKGIKAHLPYLQDLGVNALYLTPIFTARSSHGYDTTDYHQIDPHFGTNADLRALTSSLHLHNDHILLDGVFNHTGVDFAGFKSLEKDGAQSIYKNWYFVKSFPVNVEAHQTNYTGWYGIPWMPKLNVENPETKAYLLDVSTRWIRDAHIDGWRLDAADEVNHRFWQSFRQTVKKEDPNAFLLGEIWGNAHDWLQGDQFDSVMNYRFRGAVLDFFVTPKTSPTQFDSTLARIRTDYPPAAAGTMFNILDSHDTERIRTLCKDDWNRERQAVLFQMTYPGIPCIYYGDEIGLQGGRDPDNRRSMRWDAKDQDATILAFYKSLLALRKAHPVLRRGDYRTIVTDNDAATFGFLRTYGKERVVVLLNRSTLPQTIALTTSQIGSSPLTDWLHSGASLTKKGDGFTLALPSQGIVVLGTP
ncbi:MAG: alpha-glycosidase [Chthonomonadales bacterium]|nr:alpha-glycosidase [Chthonomonadales bacterium]